MPFDIGFPELLVITLVALLVIGPERLPQTVRTVSLWVGRLRRSFLKLRQEIEAEIGAEEVKQQLLEDAKGVKQIGDTVREVADELKSAAREGDDELRRAKQSHNTPPLPPDEATQHQGEELQEPGRSADR